MRALNPPRHFQHSNDVAANTDFFHDEVGRRWGRMGRASAKKHCSPWKIRNDLLINMHGRTQLSSSSYGNHPIFLPNSEQHFGCFNESRFRPDFSHHSAVHRSRRAGAGVLTYSAGAGACSPPAKLRHHLFVLQTSIIDQRKN